MQTFSAKYSTAMYGGAYFLLQQTNESTQDMLIEWLARCGHFCLPIFPLVFSRLKFIGGFLGARGGGEAPTSQKRNSGNFVHGHALLRYFSPPHNFQTTTLVP